MVNIGELVEKGLAQLGWGIYRLDRAQGIEIASALEHNTPERTDALYRNPRVLRRYLGSARRRYYEAILRLLPSEAYHQRRIADVGCGPGYFLWLLQRTVMAERHQPAALFGFDHSLAALEVARALLPQANFRSLDIYTPLLEEQFDLVICMDVLEHLLHPDRALCNLTQLVAPEGTLLLAVPNGRYDHFAGHINFWSPESWRVFLEATCPTWDIKVGVTGNGRLAGERHVNYALLSMRK